MDTEVNVTAPPLETVTVELEDRSYDILVGHGALDHDQTAAGLRADR